MTFDRVTSFGSGGGGTESRDSKRRSQQQQQQLQHNRSRSSSASNSTQNVESSQSADSSASSSSASSSSATRPHRQRSLERQQSIGSGVGQQQHSRPAKRPSYELAQQNSNLVAHLVGLESLLSERRQQEEQRRSNVGEENVEQRLDFFGFESSRPANSSDGMAKAIGLAGKTGAGAGGSGSGRSKSDSFRQKHGASLRRKNNNNNTTGGHQLITPKSSLIVERGNDDDDDDEDADYADDGDDGDNGKPKGNCQRLLLGAAIFLAKCLLSGLLCFLVTILIVYLWPAKDVPEFGDKIAPARFKPAWTGALALNEHLEKADRLFEGQFHGPESMAWSADKRSFYTGVEGGFILFVEPYEERWSVAARLNGRNLIHDETSGSGFLGGHSSWLVGDKLEQQQQMVPFCSKDVEIYGKRAEFEPKLVEISRCSRPLGIRLAPNESYLYANDPLSGFYRVDLRAPGRAAKVAKLIDFSQYQADYEAKYSSGGSSLKESSQGPTVAPLAEAVATTTTTTSEQRDRVLFGDDIAVNWGAGERNSDVIYMTDCSRMLTLRDLLRLMLEYDDTGRVLFFDTHSRQMRTLEGLAPAQMPSTTAATTTGDSLDWRNMSFPNGIELTANKSALLISDLNNRRVLMHHLRGPLAGTTRHLFWGPGHSDNIRRGVDLADGRPSYWAACGCAVEPDFEISDFFHNLVSLRIVMLKAAHFLGSTLNSLGALLEWTSLRDFGFGLKHVWLKVDVFCSHGIVYQFTEEGEILRAFHAPHFGSPFRLLSEAHQVPLLPLPLPPSPNHQQEPVDNVTAATATSAAGQQRSLLYFGSVYYPYLARLELDADQRPANTD